MKGFGAHIGKALAAGLLGAALGTPFVILTMFLKMGPPDYPGKWVFIFPFAMMVLIFSLLYTLPSAVLIIAPLTWPLRGWIARHPWPASLAYGPLGAVAGYVLSILTRGQVPLDPDGIFGAIFGATTTLALVWIIRRTRVER